MNQYLSATLSKINKYENIGMYYKKTIPVVIHVFIYVSILRKV
jgi:hypothetical protein